MRRSDILCDRSAYIDGVRVFICNGVSLSRIVHTQARAHVAGYSKQLAHQHSNPSENFRTSFDAPCTLDSHQGICEGIKSDTYNCGIHSVELRFRVWCLVLVFAVQSVRPIMLLYGVGLT